MDIIGLSGLITPSLDEMVHVAKELEREGFKQPLLIGGATTSQVHTAVKIEKNYSEPVVHVLDASRSVSTVSNLLDPGRRDGYIEEIREKYRTMRERHERRSSRKEYLTLEEARGNRFTSEWKEVPIARPNELGVTVFEDYPLEEIRKYIDWTPFFLAWELPGKYPRILEDEEAGEEARQLLEDANRMLDRIIEEEALQANGVIGLYPANSAGDDIELYTDESRKEVLTVLHQLRQQAKKTRGRPNRALSDFVAPVGSGREDYIGLFAVTAGLGIEELVAEFEEKLDDYNKILVKALADRLAEAFAERLHERVRKEYWGYAPDENFTNEQLINEEYRGIRPAPGYPACPDHTEKPIIWELMEVEEKTGIGLTGNLAMTPASSVCGMYIAHPEASYYNVGKLGRDQIEDYARRKDMSVEEVEQWLGSRLNYEPETKRTAEA